MEITWCLPVAVQIDKSAKRIMSFKSVLSWTLKSVCKEFSDLDLKYIERNCIGDVSISKKAVH